MRRIGVLAGLVALLALPAPGLADGTPGSTPGYTPVGPPAPLATIVFAKDGTMYGATGYIQPPNIPYFRIADQAQSRPYLDPAVWQSTDHGHTWRAVYHAPPGTQIAVRGVSPADPAIVFASVVEPSHPNAIERIDAGSGVATPLPFTHFAGADAGGTAYGLTLTADSSSWTLVRCPATGPCDTLPMPNEVLPCVVVDPLSRGVLASTNGVSPGQLFEVSTDGGATWAHGAPLSDACSLAFAGPAPRTLYALQFDQLFVSHDAGLTATARPMSRDVGLLIGSNPSSALRLPSAGAPVQLALDDGATLRAIDAHLPAYDVAADPLDARHLVVSAWDQTRQTWDGGATWSELHDTRFGTIVLPLVSTSGSGSRLYSLTGPSAWLSTDRGATWQQSRLPLAGSPASVLVARGDPRIAYTTISGKQFRTRDGGATWEVLEMPDMTTVAWLAPDDPSHLIAFPRLGGDFEEESFDAGATWTQVAEGAWCRFTLLSDDRRLACAGPARYDPYTAFAPAQLLHSPGVFGSPDAPGAYAIAAGLVLGDAPRGDVWHSALEPSGPFGPSSKYTAAAGAWPTPSGTVFYADDYDARATWVRRGTGRWWRIRVGDRDVQVISVLDATHVLVQLVRHDPVDTVSYEPLGIVDLAQPAVDRPQIQSDAGGLVCNVPWSPAEARTSNYVWLRDGHALQGVTGRRRAASKYDRGHRLSCAATATTSFGSVKLTADAAYRVGGARIAPPRPSVSGQPRVGAGLRCSAKLHVTWFRGTSLATSLHTRTYVVRPRDAGHAIACQTRLTDGTVTRSPAVRIPRAAAA